MYPYHNKIKQRIRNRELVKYEYVDKYKDISPKISKKAKIFKNAVIAGDVTIHDYVNVSDYETQELIEQVENTITNAIKST